MSVIFASVFFSQDIFNTTCPFPSHCPKWHHCNRFPSKNSACIPPLIIVCYMRNLSLISPPKKNVQIAQFVIVYYPTILHFMILLLLYNRCFQTLNWINAYYAYVTTENTFGVKLFSSVQHKIHCIELNLFYLIWLFSKRHGCNHESFWMQVRVYSLSETSSRVSHTLSRQSY
jgi:hypothetical protein